MPGSRLARAVMVIVAIVVIVGLVMATFTSPIVY